MTHFRALATAPFDLGVFNEVCQQRVRRTVGYLFLLILLASVASSIGVTLSLRGFARRVLPEIDKLPTVTIRHGEASANVEQPWRQSFGRERGREMVAIIDTTGTVTDFKDGEAGFLLKRRQLLIKKEDGTRQDVELSQLDDMTIGPTQVKEWLKKGQLWAPLVVLLAAFVYFSMTKWFHAMLFTLVALIAASRRRNLLGFGALFAASCYALTLPVALGALESLFSVDIPYFWLGYTVLANVYIVLAIRRIPDVAPDVNPAANP
jgi:hypothetical protein